MKDILPGIKTFVLERKIYRIEDMKCKNVKCRGMHPGFEFQNGKSGFFKCSCTPP